MGTCFGDDGGGDDDDEVGVIFYNQNQTSIYEDKKTLFWSSIEYHITIFQTNH